MNVVSCQQRLEIECLFVCGGGRHMYTLGVLSGQWLTTHNAFLVQAMTVLSMGTSKQADYGVYHYRM